MIPFKFWQYKMILLPYPFPNKQMDSTSKQCGKREESYTVALQGVLSYKYKRREAMVVIVRSTSTTNTNSAVSLHVPLSPLP